MSDDDFSHQITRSQETGEGGEGRSVLVFKTVFPVFDSSPLQCSVELQTNLREVRSFIITEREPTRAFSCLKAANDGKLQTS